MHTRVYPHADTRRHILMHVLTHIHKRRTSSIRTWHAPVPPSHPHLLISFSFVMVNAATIVSSAVSFVLPKAWCGVRTHVVMNSLKKMHCQVLREELCCDIVICNAFSFPSCIFLSSFAPLSEWQQQYFFFFVAGVNCQVLPLWLAQRLCCATPSAVFHRSSYCGTPCVQAHLSCFGSYCPPRMSLTAYLAFGVLLNEMMYFFWGKQVYTVTSCRHAGWRSAV